MESLNHRSLRYGDHSLQTVDVWERPVDERVPAEGSNRYFFIYIHGGAWRDPQQLTDTAVPSIKLLAANDSPYIGRDRIAGFASIGYRLSPHPNFPQDASSTPADELRAARHPDHINDVWAALAKLGEYEKHAKGSPGDYIAHDRYIIYGHSCGGFLTYQLWMGAQATLSPSFGKAPPYIVGFEGIYDLRGLVDRGGSPAHGGGPGTGFAVALLSIATGSFGDDRSAWDTASPGKYDWTTLPDAPGPKRLAVVAYSMEDELVDVGEIDTLEAALRHGEASGKFSLAVARDLHGGHDDVHTDGHEIARVLTETVRQLDSRL
ncbi:hypothetical protein F503_00620 [Ophiostoma piceae UAMH 11346]|uniref:Kynurenine formamidase n=1 Tax=Ophiostoma piceae (strain UAMH 11346) TaxID=1262450 RepID=S3CMY5_OPHP1|nr:hypothetical protein F503_00620 [Ophiostoma piceae UAMH 11346]